MASNQFFHLALFFLLSRLASAAYISDGVLESHAVTGRYLLQQKSDCPVNFENQNYTIITSQCKGPNYNATICCNAFKELACPFMDQINDLKNDCASTLFSYINLYGKYPPGLFSSLCHDDKNGLDCTQVLDSRDKNSAKKSGAVRKYGLPSLAMTAGTGFVMLLFNYVV